MRVVLDTNVLINGVQDQNSYAFRIIDACFQGKIIPLISRKIEQENKLLIRKTVLDQEYQERLEDYFRRAETVKIKSHLNEIPDDPEDNKFLEAAYDGQADYIVTADRHLLDVSPYAGVDILTPQEFWQRHAEDLGGSSEWQAWMKNLVGF